MAFIYEYQRDIIEVVIDAGKETEERKTGYDIDNYGRRDDLGNRIFLAREVKEAFPNNPPCTSGANSIMQIIFETELTPEEKTVLDTIVYNHKNNIK